MEFLNDPGIWLLASFVIFVGLIVKFGKAALLGMLDARINAIREEIKTAENLRIEAQEMLAQYQRKHKDSMKDAEQILETAKEQASEIKKQADVELKETIKRREKQLTERLDRMKQTAKDEIREYAANLAIEATSEIIADKLDKKANDKLVDAAIKNVGANIH